MQIPTLQGSFSEHRALRQKMSIQLVAFIELESWTAFIRLRKLKLIRSKKNGTKMVKMQKLYFRGVFFPVYRLSGQLSEFSFPMDRLPRKFPPRLLFRLRPPFIILRFMITNKGYNVGTNIQTLLSKHCLRAYLLV